jgi:hypothetical protein
MDKKKTVRNTKTDPQNVKVYHYSVWVTAPQKELIDRKIEQANTSASNFFLNLVSDISIKRPKKKSLPAHVAEKISNLERLSGLLALSALKAKDKEMIAENWRESSQNVKYITQLIFAWIFEDLEFTKHRKLLREVHENLNDLYQFLNTIETLKSNTNQFQSKTLVLEKISSLYYKVEDVMKGYDTHFDFHNVPKNIAKYVWKENEIEAANNVHQGIKDLVQSSIKGSNK